MSRFLLLALLAKNELRAFKLGVASKECQGGRSFRGSFLARGNAAVAREQGVKERTVVVEYPSLEKATAAYDSPAYAEALKALGDGVVRDLRIVKGVE
jgi:uncharacterized protein (DUF1330 family)